MAKNKISSILYSADSRLATRNVRCLFLRFVRNMKTEDL